MPLVSHKPTSTTSMGTLDSLDLLLASLSSPQRAEAAACESGTRLLLHRCPWHPAQLGPAQRHGWPDQRGLGPQPRPHATHRSPGEGSSTRARPGLLSALTSATALQAKPRQEAAPGCMTDGRGMMQRAHGGHYSARDNNLMLSVTKRVHLKASGSMK